MAFRIEAKRLLLGLVGPSSSRGVRGHRSSGGRRPSSARAPDRMKAAVAVCLCAAAACSGQGSGERSARNRSNLEQDDLIKAIDVFYDNGASGLSCNNVQAAIDRLASRAFDERGLIESLQTRAGHVEERVAILESRQSDYAALRNLLRSPGTLNSPTNPIDFTQLKGVPVFAANGYRAGPGINISGDVVSSTAPQGPPGPTGPPGPPGVPGPPGHSLGRVPLYRCKNTCPIADQCLRRGAVTFDACDCFPDHPGQCDGAVDTGLRVL